MNQNQNVNKISANDNIYQNSNTLNQDPSETEDGDSSLPQEVPPTKEVPEQQPLTKAGSHSDEFQNDRDTSKAGGREGRDSEPSDSRNKDGEEE